MGGYQRGRFLACRLGRSLDAPHRGAATPFGIKLYYFLPLPCRQAILFYTVSAWEGVSERQWRSAANRSPLPLRSVLDAPHRGAGPEPAGETRGWEAHSFSRQQARPGGGYSKIDPLGSEDHRAGFILLSRAGKRDGSKHRKLM